MATFDGFLRLLRKRVHLTQGELASLVGYSIAQINRLERGARPPDPSVVEARFIDALGLKSGSTDAIRLIELAREAAKRSFRDGAAGDAANETTQTLFPEKLPSPATDLLGREADIEAALKIFGRSNTRLLTLVGPPGVGKTRLAIELAQLTESQHQHGALFVALASVTDGRLIADAVLQAMGITSTSQDPLTQLKNVLHRRDMVLVLDNFEQLLEHTHADGATRIVAELMAAASQMKLLITSRAPLRLNGETLYEVPVLTPSAAQELFVQRAIALRPLFKLEQKDLQTIAEICRRLDHLPLAIELAAARIPLFEPAALLKRLGEPLTLLTLGSNDLPQRQRTLKGAIAWSYALLSPDEQTLFRRLGIFADGCTMTMIEAVVADGLTNPTIDLVQSLVDKSLLKTESVNGEMRFRLLEMLREFASDLLAQSPEAFTIARRNAQWFVEQVDGMQSDPAIGDSLIWFDWFDAEINNIRSVIHWSLQSGYIAYGLQIAANLKVTWRLHGPVRDGFQLTMNLLAHPDARSNLHLYGRVLLTAAYVSEEVGDNALSEQQLVEAEAIFRNIGDKRFLAWALSQRGDHAITRGDYLSARSLLGESEALFREVSDYRGLAIALLWFGTIERDQDNFQQALKIYDEVAFLARKIKSPVVTYLAAGWTGFVYHRMGDLERAAVLTEKALAICQANLSLGSSAIMLGALGNIAFEKGDLVGAIKWYEQGCELMESHGNPDMRAATLIGLGFATHLNGDSARGESLLLEAIQTHWECGRTSYIPDSLIRLAWIAVDQCNLAHAVRLIAAAEAWYEQMAVSLTAAEQVFHQPRLEFAKSAMTQLEFEMLWQEGQAMDHRTAVAYALRGM